MTLLLRYSLLQISEYTVTFGCNGEQISTNIWSFWFCTGFLQQLQMGEKGYMSELGIPKLQGHVWLMTSVKYSSRTWCERVIYISRFWNLCTELLRSLCSNQSSTGNAAPSEMACCNWSPYWKSAKWNGYRSHDMYQGILVLFVTPPFCSASFPFWCYYKKNLLWFL